jgi:hypothetical protein
MKAKRSLTGLALVAVLGCVMLLAGCGASTANVSASDQAAAKQQFLSRGANGTPGPSSGTPGTTGLTGRAPGVAGAIQAINGNQITIKSQANGTVTVVQLNAGAPVLKQAAAQVSDIKVGETVTATGTANGNTVDAQVVQIGNAGLGGGGGGGGGGFNGTPGPGRQGNAGGTPVPNANGTPGVPRAFVSGTVANVAGNTITVNTANSTTATFTISSSTRLQKVTNIQTSDLKVGDNVVAAGQQNGSVFDASSIQVVAAGTGFTGGLGGAGSGAQAGPTATP